jgi:hypothetical protein
MATNYEEVYASFLSKITDYSFIKLSEEELKSQLKQYLKSSIARFKRPRVDLKDIDDINKSFNQDLSLSEIEILATLMIVEYIRPQMNSATIMKQVMTDKEFRFYSQKNHLDGLASLYTMMKKEAETLMRDYSFERLGDKDDK